MKTTSIRARSLALALLSTTAYCGMSAQPAQAQAASTAPVRQSIDGNGVDLFYGTINLDAPALKMGPDGPQGIAYRKLIRGSGSSDNLIATLDISGGVATVGLGDTSDSFTVSGSTYTPTEGNGASLSYDGTAQVYTYTTAAGTVMHFDQNKSNSGSFTSNGGRVTDITAADGKRLVFSYDSVTYCSSYKNGASGTICLSHSYAYRLANVRNSFGYRINMAYPNILIDPDDPFADLNAWATPNGVSGANLAVSGGTMPSESFAETYVGGVDTFSVTDPMGRVTRYRYGAGGVAGVTRPGNSSEDVTIGWTSGRVTSVTTPAGTTGYAASDSGNNRTVTVTDPLSHATTYVFDIALRRVISVTDALGHTTSYQYDSSGRPTRVTAPEGNYVAYTYDARGNVTQTQAVAKDGVTTLATSASFPSSCTNAATCNKPTSTTDARGNTTDYSYDSTSGEVLSVTLPAPTGGATRPQTRYGYTSMQAYFSNGSAIVASGEPVNLLTSTSTCQTGASCSGTSDEVATSISYGPQTAGVSNNLLPVSVSQGAGNGSLTASTAMAYDAVGNLTSVDGPLAGTADTTVYRWDADRELVGTVSPDPDGAGPLRNRAVRTTYDGHGLVTRVEQGTVASQSDADWAGFSTLQEVDVGYDSAWRPVTQSLVSGGTTYSLTQTSYDAAGRVDCVATRMNPSTYGALPSSACTATTAGSYGADRIVNYTYDAADERTKVTSAYGTADQSDEVTTTYTSNGKVQTVTDAEANKTTYVYDGFDRLSQTLYPSTIKGSGTSNSSDYEQLGYDANGNVTSRRLRDGNSIGYTFDALNRMTYKDLPGTEPDVTYAYDLLGRMTSASQSGNALSFTYDALGRNLTQTGPQGTLTSSYDIGGRRTRIAHPDGFYVDQDYLVTGELAHIREYGATSGVGVLATFGYDDLGRRTSLTRGNGTVTGYGYDPASRLTQLAEDLAGTSYDETLGFSYNPAGQITSNTRSNDSYAWTGHYNVNRGYTANGLNQYTASGSVTPTYDLRGNLTSAGSTTYTYSSENLLTSASGGITLSYDPAMRLYQTAGGTPGTTRFAYDGADLIAEYNGSNALQRRFVHGPGMDEPIVWYEGSGTTDRRFLHRDERGSVVAVTDSSGTVLSVNTYDEYGKPGSTNSGRFQYTGQTWLPELGMYYYKARIYSPTLGRFLQTDPIGYGDSLNLYSYVMGDPINRADSTGLRIAWVCVGTRCGYMKVGSDAADRFFSDAPTAAPAQPTKDDPEVTTCPIVGAKITGVGPNQANGTNPTAISQTPGRDIPRGGVAIDPTDFGVSDASGARRDVFRNITIIPLWEGAERPSNNAPAIPRGLPSRGPYTVVDVIGPASARNQPGFQIDLYRYRSQAQAAASTRNVPVAVAVPVNNLGVTCPTGK